MKLLLTGESVDSGKKLPINSKKGLASPGSLYPEVPPEEKPALQGVQEGVEFFENVLKDRTKPVLVYVDPDVDGYFAAYFIIRVLEEMGVKYSYYINDKREHGFLLPIDSVAGKYHVINGDFTITEEQIQGLVDAGSNVLSMDHHDVPDSDKPIVKRKEGVLGVYINNQYSFEPDEWRYLSGAQVVLYTLRHILNHMGRKDSVIFSEEYTALGAITLLSDVRDLNNPHARHELSVLYNAKYRGEIRRLFDGVMKGRKDYSYGVPRFDRTFVDFTFTPTINSLIRLGREYEAFEFICGGSLTIGEESPQSVQKAFVKRIIDSAVVRDFGMLRIVRIDETKFTGLDKKIVSNFVGLVCSKLTDGGKNVLGYVVQDDGSVGRTSFRGTKTGINYRSSLEGVIDARGHEIAFGVKNFNPSAKVFKQVVNIINTLEKNSKESLKVIEMESLVGVKEIAIANEFLNNEDRTYIRYTGSLATVVYESDKITKWNLNGVEVLQFSKELDIHKDLILPSMDRKSVSLVLERVSA